MCELVTEFGTGGGVFDPDALEPKLKRVYRTWEAWPADAQFALHALGWLHGPGFRHDGLRASVNGPSPDFTQAAVEVAGMSNAGHPCVIAVHDRAAHALRNAGAVLVQDRCLEILYYPFFLC